MLDTAARRQPELFTLEDAPLPAFGGCKPFRTQLLKWVGNKQKQADEIMRPYVEQTALKLPTN